MSYEKIPEFDFKGIKRITIPKVDADFTDENNYGWEIIKKYLSDILATHKENARKIDYLYNYFLGIQDIREKERTHDINKTNNNKEVENHANRQVEFKVGFLCGEMRDYTHKSDSDSDDLTILDRYFTDCKFFSKDADLKEWIYTCGIGVTKTTPRTDIIISERKKLLGNGIVTRYKTANEGFDIDFQAPFNFVLKDPRHNFKVYSSGDGEEALFDVSYVDIDLSNDNEQPNIQKRLRIETRYCIFEFNSDSAFANFYWNDNDKVLKLPKKLHYLPLIEYSVNKDRIGIVEKNRSSFNTINLFRSAVNDMIIDNANAILVFKNVDIESEEVKEMRRAGAIIISDSQNARQGGIAGLDTVTIEIPLDKMTTYLDQVMQNAYDIVGVPLASGQVTSGGDTGQARLLGGGWNNAYIIIHKEIMKLLEFDYQQLELFLMLCKKIPKCKLNELFPSQVEINYRVNQNDNLLVRTQSMLNLYQMNCDYEYILKTCGTSNDIKTDAKKWASRDETAKKQAETQNTTEKIAVEESNLNDNNSQE